MNNKFKWDELPEEIQSLIMYQLYFDNGPKNNDGIGMKK